MFTVVYVESNIVRRIVCVCVCVNIYIYIYSFIYLFFFAKDNGYERISDMHAQFSPTMLQNDKYLLKHNLQRNIHCYKEIYLSE